MTTAPLPPDKPDEILINYTEALRVAMNQRFNGVQDMMIAKDEAKAAIQALISAREKEARIDELKLLQLSDDIPDDVKDVIYYPHIKDRYNELKDKESSSE